MADDAPDPAEPPAAAVDTASERAYQATIASLENNGGAYNPGLSETLLALGLNLQAQGRHEEAIHKFKRGAHLARINDGLYCQQQIPLLQGEIDSLVASGDYQAADERQRYLYRVQTRTMDSGPDLAAAYMQQAQWQYQAYRLQLDSQGYARLMSMWDLYRLALDDTITREGDDSPQLLPPLYGMLQTQYLISNYEWEDRRDNLSDDLRARESMLRFNAYRNENFAKGEAVIAAIHNIEARQAPTGGDPVAALVMLGDWRLWHGDRDGAWEVYQQAEVELAQADDAQQRMAAMFGEPVALPNLPGLDPLPPVAPDPEQADILLEFGVNQRGKVVDMQRLDDHEEWDSQATHLMRSLRHTRFRPRFAAGEPVETEKLVRAFNLQ